MIADGWSKDARICPTQFRLVLCVKPREVKLRLAREAITCLLPVYQVLAVEDRYSWEILERAVDKVENLPVCYTHLGRHESREAQGCGILEPECSETL